MTRHILIAVGPDRSEAALNASVEWARYSGAKLTLLHLFDTSPWWACSVDMPGLADLFSVFDKQMQEIVHYCCEVIRCAELDEQTRILTRPLNGVSVGSAIAGIAQELNVDLIVLGAGRKSKWCFRMKRTSAIVERLTNCSILKISNANQWCMTDAARGMHQLPSTPSCVNA